MCRHFCFVLLALALTIGQQQAKDTNDLNTLLKVILTNVNQMNDGNANLLSYFSTYFNQGIPPGGFVWAPGVIETEPIQKSPWQSMQVFEEYMDDESLLDTLSPVSKEYFPFANITTGSYDCTTIDNPAFGIKGGQKVRIFLIRLNSNIPSEVIAPSSIKKWQVPLAELARYVATDDELVARIQDFVSS